MRRRGFSLIETLVVVSIIGLLAGLLMPALKSVRAAGRQTWCQSNQRQLMMATQSYLTTWDHYPAALRYAIENGTMHQIAWDHETTLSGTPVRLGPLFHHVDTPIDVFQCPEHHGNGNNGGVPHSGYNYNTTFVGGEASFGQTGWDAVRGGLPPHRCRRCTDVALFGDGGYVGGANKFMRAPLNTVEASLSTVYGGGQAFRHAGTTNIVCLDGHIEIVHAPSPGALANDLLLETVLGFPDNGFLSDDDSAYDPR